MLVGAPPCLNHPFELRRKFVLKARQRVDSVDGGVLPVSHFDMEVRDSMLVGVTDDAELADAVYEETKSSSEAPLLFGHIDQHELQPQCVDCSHEFRRRLRRRR
ncbi:hypothetical protein LILAB_08735 [Corallococcus macrosporus]|uniref:Uncharacterized protein n=1 Tax=Myxococcus fulvus (strain ATCC BAA-855 / HW-1) TaxID=483219 RepID=F8CGU9_MYXFH|nr:hypothetical protein LILAB_08735 [Corallococcus macrosporus]